MQIQPPGGSQYTQTHAQPGQSTTDLSLTEKDALLEQLRTELEQKKLELKVEAALEVVRTKAMAMQKSEELPAAAHVLYQQVRGLGLPVISCGYNIWEKEDKVCTAWMSDSSDTIQPSFKIPLTESPAFIRFLESRQKEEHFYAEEVSGDELAAHYNYMLTLPNFQNIIERFLKAGYALPCYQVNHVVNFGHGNVIFITYQPVPEAWEIFKRFAAVFEQTYTRFLDLQKAEAQAREARIETALEKVRSRTMAMQRSDELTDVAMLLFQQVKELGIKAWTTGFNVWQPDNTAYIDYVTDPSGHFLEPYVVDLTSHPAFAMIREAKQRGNDFFVSFVEGEQIAEMYQLLSSFASKGQFQKILDSGFQFPTHQFNHIVFGAQVSLLFITYEACPEGWDIFKRFGKVFEQTYTRFLDLQKAEAQAREANIEAALEKIRSTSLAMHQSDELEKVVTILFEKLTELKLSFSGAGIFVFDEGERKIQHWIKGLGLSPLKNTLPYDSYFAQNTIVKDLLFAKENGRNVLNKTYSKDEKNQFFLYISSYNDSSKIPDAVKEFINNAEAFTMSLAAEKHCLIGLDNWLGTEISEEEFQVLRRFARVFDQAYVRFLDLQKAEAQAREAQIEAALERVRSRTMAMYRSQEMADILAKIFQELKQLDIVLNRILIWIFNHDERYIDWWSANAEVENTAESYRVDYNEHPVFLSYLKAWQERIPLYKYTIAGDTKRSWEDYLFTKTELSKIPVPIQRGLTAEGTIFTTSAISDYGLIMAGSQEPLSAENTDIIQRLGRVFQQSYTRYLDVQKAEAQAREARIELGLERVRARAMAMHSSTELRDVAQILFEKLWPMDFVFDDGAVNILVFKESSKDHVQWSADSTQAYVTSFEVAYTEHSIPASLMQARESGVDFFSKIFPFEEKNEYFQYLFEHTNYRNLPHAVQKRILESEHYGFSVAFAQKSAILIPTNSGRLVPEDKKDILKRFANVFDQAFIRFLDLQKAEAQAREALIEAALEKIRSSSLAMHHSEDIKNVVYILFEKLNELKVIRDTIAIQLFDFETKDSLFWPGNTLQDEPPKVKLPYDEKMMQEDTCHRDLWNAMKNGQVIFNKPYLKTQKDLWFKYVFAHNDFTVIHPHARERIERAKIHTVCFIPEKNSALFADSWDGSLYSEDDLKVLKRAAKVFEQAYIRFLDLQKAEGQAREAKIEAALEKIRSRSLGMHHSVELKDVVAIFFEKLKELDLVFDGGAGIHLFTEGSRDAVIWVAAPDLKEPACINLPYDETAFMNNPIIMDVWNAKKSGKHIYNKFYAFEEKNRYFNYVFKHNDLVTLPEFSREFLLKADSYTASFIAERNSLLGANSWTRQQFSEKDFEVLKRIARVFEQAYIRFLDLQKAEAQAREAKIEAAMERLRSKAMAMQTSGELNDLIQVMYIELKRLDESLNRCFIMIFNEQTKGVTWWMAGDDVAPTNNAYYIPFSEHAPQLAYLKGWEEQQEKWQYIMEGDEKKNWDRFLFTETELAKLPDFVIENMKSFGKIYLDASFNHFGCLTTGSAQPLSEDSFNVLIRFSKVFDLSYTRFNDLKQAESQAKEAIKTSSLDRIRAEIASMRTANDLERITPLIWKELTVLEVPFIRCGVFIMDEVDELIHTFLSTPDGHAIASFHLPYATPGNIKEIRNHWQHKEVYTDHWDDNTYHEFTAALVEQGALASPEQYLKTFPPGGFYLHFLPFLQGMLYVGSLEPLVQDELNLTQSIADAFSTAFARYEDFNKLEAAKQQVENTLQELRDTQNQLIQSEKMASLGELTAGIAHEIQNPLNFVSNFCEVNTELIKELEHEIDGGNFDVAKEIANDIKGNEQKILHHSKRADSIVKGMLQHSRSSNGRKEPTDINMLADEYLRLSYHGMRARDKTFYAISKYHFDGAIGKIDVVPQDMGRVLLNLFNNAFYSLAEKKKKGQQGYEPTIELTTKRNPNGILICVKDNGMGIPQVVLEKIYQPFFTTKPTGQGTGLGLSMSYDIITKGHGGTLEARTKEGDYAQFEILLPVQSSSIT